MTLSLSRKGSSELSSSRKGLREFFFAMLALGGTTLATTGCQVRVVDPEVAVVPYRSDLVYVRPGVYVVADSDVAVYYVDGRYYYVENGSWYSRRNPHDHWVVVHHGYVPRTIVTLDHTRYVRVPRAHGSVAHQHGHHHPQSYHTEPRSLGAGRRDSSQVRVAETGTHAESGARFDLERQPSRAPAAPAHPSKGHARRLAKDENGVPTHRAQEGAVESSSATFKASSSSPPKARKLKRSRKPAPDHLTAR